MKYIYTAKIFSIFQLIKVQYFKGESNNIIQKSLVNPSIPYNYTVYPGIHASIIIQSASRSNDIDFSLLFLLLLSYSLRVVSR